MDENLQQSEVSIIPAETASAKGAFPKKKLTAILSAAIIVLCAVAAIIVNANRPINRFDHALKAGEYDVAAAIYTQNSSDEKFTVKSAEKVSALLSASLEKYAGGSMTYEDINTLLNKTTSYKGVENHAEIKSQVKLILTSKQAYEQASEDAEKKLYLKALDGYSAVIEEDTENYSSAQKAIASTTELLCSDAIEQATVFMNQDDAVRAYEALSAVGDYKNDAVTQMLAEVTEKAQGQISGQAQALSDSGDYKGAYLLLSEQPDSLKNDKIKAIESSALENLLAQLKATLKVEYDSIYKVYSIRPTKWGDNVMPTVVYTLPDTPLSSGGLDDVSFSMYFSFVHDSWIFMDTIFIDCDGTQFSLKVDSSKRNTDVFWWGKIYEGTLYSHIPDSTEAGANGHADLGDIVKAFESSDRITVRYSGTGGYKDVTLTKNEIKNVANMWTVYQILYNDASLVNALM